jgi:cytoskeletal protein RodZ
MATQLYTEVPAPEAHLEDEELHHEEPASKPRWYFGNGMGKKIAGFIVVILVIATLWYAYRKRSQVGNGAVQFDDNTAALTDETQSTSSSAATTTPTDTSKRNIVQPTTNVQPALTGTVTNTVAAAVPATDSISPNPANGMAFTGSGKFQVYRQGNLTWRVDTETGHTCILFATMEEWRKPIVYQHGCNNS